ncbi:MAG: rhodanese-like domain-containing protein [Brevundimonas sp.]|uniref:rhodanese-like domain-containing protein n=1 Tax=Brevundimonas sp. TaxID=1871086 RepID=UPI0025881D14|nr:rhodanese-like domain-containing protein [Brevundimonas sp.]MCV0416385.1 rhodanese-like domain-containing protein [Brevundimonas sp.]
MVDAVSPRQAMGLLVSGQAVLIDVREPDEFAASHIPYALSAPLARTAAILRDMDLPADRAIVFQCQKGARGGQACAAIGAVAPGGQPVFNLDGGIEAWRRDGLPIVEAAPGGPPVSIFRQVQIVVGTLVTLGVLAGFAIHPAGFVVAGLLGAALAAAGATGWCGLAMLLSQAPWNRPRGPAASP